MADRVRYIMDKMASTFARMQELDIFTHDEIKSIIKSRTDFEYIMMRRQLTEGDYVKYIEYETNLNRLHQLRCVAAGHGVKNKDIQVSLYIASLLFYI